MVANADDDVETSVLVDKFGIAINYWNNIRDSRNFDETPIFITAAHSIINKQPVDDSATLMDWSKAAPFPKRKQTARGTAPNQKKG